MHNRLKELRAGQRWTQQDVGQRVGVSRQAVNALETEKHDPSLDLAYRIAALFGLPVEEVFRNPYRAPIQVVERVPNDGDRAKKLNRW